MSLEAVKWALTDAPIPTSTSAGEPSPSAMAVVLIGLANHANPDGRDAYPSIARLAGYGRISERTVIRCLAHLLVLGLITEGNPAAVALYLRSDRRPNPYHLNLEAKRSNTPKPPVDNPVSRGDTVTPRGPSGVTPCPSRGDTVSPEPREEPKEIKEREGRRSAGPPPPPTTLPGPNRPADRCQQHAGTPSSAPCRGCGLARVAAEHWDTRTRQQAAQHAARAQHEALELKARAVQDCQLCDDHGRLDRMPCHHRPELCRPAHHGATLFAAAKTRLLAELAAPDDHAHPGRTGAA